MEENREVEEDRELEEDRVEQGRGTTGGQQREDSLSFFPSFLTCCKYKRGTYTRLNGAKTRVSHPVGSRDSPRERKKDPLEPRGQLHNHRLRETPVFLLQPRYQIS